MRASNAVKLTVQQRLGFEIALARSRIEMAYERMQKDLHEYGKYTDTTGIELHEAEQILAALERVSGDFYRRTIANMKAYREEQKRTAKEEAEMAMANARWAQETRT